MRPKLLADSAFGMPRRLLRGLSFAAVCIAVGACASMFKITPETDDGKPAKPAIADKPKPTPTPKTEPPPKVAREPKAEKPKAVVNADSISRVAAARDSVRKVASAKESARRDSIRVANAERDSTQAAARAAVKAQADADKAKKVVADAIAKAQSDSIKAAIAAAAPSKLAASSKPNKNATVVAANPPVIRQPDPIIEAPIIEPPAAASDSTGIARLVHAAALWNAVRLYHPAASQHLAWDNATVRHITDVRGARSRNEYANAIREWLNTLDDHETRLQSAADVAPATLPPTSSTPNFTTVVDVIAPAKKNTAAIVDTTFVLAWPAGVVANDSSTWLAFQDQSNRIARASHVVIDLRAQRPSNRELDVPYNSSVNAFQTSFASKFATFPAVGPSIRRRAYEGWPDERRGIAEPFGNAMWRVSNPLTIVPAGAPPIANRRVVVVADLSSEIPSSLLALISSRQATLLADNGVGQSAYVPYSVVLLGEGLSARVRLGELLNADGSIGVQPDSIIRSPSVRDESAILKSAILVARGLLNVSSRRHLVVDNDALYANADWNFAHYPIMGARLLGAFKMWGTVRDFHAYRELQDENIDAALQRIIPRVEAARDADGYAGAMLDLAAVTDDAQATLASPSVTQHFGSAWAPFRARWIEGRAIVTQVTNDAAGLAVGDEITAADGYPMPAYVAERRRFGAASNDWTRMRNIMDALPRGVAGEASYRARDASNRDKQLSITRTPQNGTKLQRTERYNTPVWRELTSSIGYIDLDRTTRENIDSALTALRSMKAIVLDARGTGGSTNEVSNETFDYYYSSVMFRVNTVLSASIARQSIPLGSEPCLPAAVGELAPCYHERRTFDNIIGTDAPKMYGGRTVLLIDERTQGSLEQLGLALESVGNTTFIGTPSAGASGSVTGLKLPGQMSFTFSGSEIRHADGRQLQRVGLTPQVDARPTVKGIRAGTDEVLLRAQQYLQELIDPALRKKK
ncbi:MAG: S41 family peptidase [Gemmatimonadaceae bacterium]